MSPLFLPQEGELLSTKELLCEKGTFLVKSSVKDLKPKHPLTKLCSSAEFETGASVYSNNQPIDEDNFDPTKIKCGVNLYLMM